MEIESFLQKEKIIIRKRYLSQIILQHKINSNLSRSKNNFDLNSLFLGSHFRKLRKKLSA